MDLTTKTWVSTAWDVSGAGLSSSSKKTIILNIQRQHIDETVLNHSKQIIEVNLVQMLQDRAR